MNRNQRSSTSACQPAAPGCKADCPSHFQNVPNPHPPQTPLPEGPTATSLLHCTGAAAARAQTHPQSWRRRGCCRDGSGRPWGARVTASSRRTHLAQPRDEKPNPEPEPTPGSSGLHKAVLGRRWLSEGTGFGDCRRSGRGGHHPAPPNTLLHGPAREGNCEQGQRR